MNHNPVIVALDVETRAEALALVKAIGPNVEFYKVGMELYAASGPDMVRELCDCGKQVFLDLKFYDIPETVRRAVAQVARLGARFLTVHAVEQVMRAAVEGKGESRLQLLGVTVLTSFAPEDLAGLGYACPVSELVALRARQAVAARVDGLVCSPLEVAAVRALAGPSAVLVTPGVRSPGASHGDQKRVASPAEAIRNGADYLVMGRQITRAVDPAGEATRVLAEIAGVRRASACPPEEQ
jgi:orotidine-5'-phosphate decarboxylase